MRLQELVFAETELNDIEMRMGQILELQQDFETDLRMLDATAALATASRVDVIQSARVPTQMSFPKIDRKSTRLNSSHSQQSRMPSSA